MKPVLRRVLSLALVLAITALLLEVGLRALALLPGHAGGLATDPEVGIIILGRMAALYHPLRLASDWDEYYLLRLLRILARKFRGGPQSHTNESIAACATSPSTAARLNSFLLTVYDGEIEIHDIAGVARVKEGFAGMSDLVVQMEATAVASGARILFVLAPSEIQLDQNMSESVLRCLGKHDTRYDFLRPQQLLREQLEARGIPYLDLWPALSRYPTTATYTPLDTHWNAFGNEVVAEAISAKLRELHATEAAR